MPPNILFICSDQHRRDAMGCAGHPRVRTPNLNRLAREGARFGLVDIYPTLLDRAGAPVEPDLPGRGLLPLLREDAMGERQVFAETAAAALYAFASTISRACCRILVAASS